ncbi:triadin-like isoform X4 [Syngnathus scovelli]|uniref:triadin-like isoform X4 n=1 Tax=Syngnathus scovelli TaxID=161590 RepID=UPI0035CA4D16
MVIAERQPSSKSKAPMSGRHKSIVDDLVLTFSSPAGWLLAAALVITWAAVAVLVFDLLDDKTLAGSEPRPSSFCFSAQWECHPFVSMTTRHTVTTPCVSLLVCRLLPPPASPGEV